MVTGGLAGTCRCTASRYDWQDWSIRASALEVVGSSSNSTSNRCQHINWPPSHLDHVRLLSGCELTILLKQHITLRILRFVVHQQRSKQNTFPAPVSTCRLCKSWHMHLGTLGKAWQAQCAPNARQASGNAIPTKTTGLAPGSRFVRCRGCVSPSRLSEPRPPLSLRSR